MERTGIGEPSVTLQRSIVPEIRTQLLASVLGAITNGLGSALSTPELKDVRMMGNQLAKMVLIGMTKMFGDSPQANAIYRNKSLQPLEKLFQIGDLFIIGLLKSPEFHATYGEELDKHLDQLRKELNFYFNES